MKSLRSHATDESQRPIAAGRRLRRRRENFATEGNEKVAEPYTQTMARWPRYRFRTWARECLPRPLAYLFPPGDKDCGRHEWFRTDERTDLCWHCIVGKREHMPTRIDSTSRLWQGLNRAARAGSPSAQKIIGRMIAEDEEARRAMSA